MFYVQSSIELLYAINHSFIHSLNIIGCLLNIISLTGVDMFFKYCDILIPYFRAYTLHTHITRTRLYLAQNRIFSTKKIVKPAPSYTPLRRPVILPPMHHSCDCSRPHGREREGGREKQCHRQSKQSHLKLHGHCSVHGRAARRI